MKADVTNGRIIEISGGRMFRKTIITFVAGSVFFAVVSCGGGGGVKVDTGLETLTGIDNYDFTWIESADSEVKDIFIGQYKEYCNNYEDEACYLLNGKIKGVTLEPYQPEAIRGSCDIGGDLTISTGPLEDSLENGITVELEEQHFEVDSFEVEGTTVEGMYFYIEDCDYVKVTVNSGGGSLVTGGDDDASEGDS